MTTRKGKRMSKSQKRNGYVCGCGNRLENWAPSMVKRHEYTEKHLEWAGAKLKINLDLNNLNRVHESPVIRKARKDLFYCRECAQQRRQNPETGKDIMGHSGPTGKVKPVVVAATVAEVLEKTGLSTNSSDVSTSLDKLEHEVKERIRVSEKMLGHIDAMRKVLSE